MGVFRANASLLHTAIHEVVVAERAARLRDRSSHRRGEVEDAWRGTQAISQ